MSYLDNFSFQVLGNEKAPKLVFLHGLMGAGANWRKVTSAFANEYHILIYDQRGHGRSFQPERGYAPEDYADDLAAILDELGWTRIILVGHSMGGRNALNFAFRWPHRVIGLVLEDIGPDANPVAISRIERLLSLVPTPFASRQAAKDFLLNKFPKMISENPHANDLAQFFFSNIVEKNGGADWRFSRDAINASLREGRAHDRWHELKGLKVPTLVIRGAESDELSPDVFKRMCQEQPLARGVEVPGAGHWVHFDQVEDFISILKKFFMGLLVTG